MKRNKILLIILCVLILLLIIIVIVRLNIKTIADIILTEDNFDTISEEYFEKENLSDDFLYFSFAVDYWSSTKAVYGRTINDLIKEGKTLMEENNYSLLKYKKEILEKEQLLKQVEEDIKKFDEMIPQNDLFLSEFSD
ncbi:MAG: hypothetical protein IKP28_06220 [Clostridia bacterium]|nr:hypothetical protein [Clostridia bacterium]